MNKFFSPSPIALDTIIAILRIVIGLLLIYHGHEIFRPEIMKTYFDWDPFKTSFGKFIVYVGKGSELVAGIFLLLGLLTRVEAVVALGTFLYITFFVGQGRFWYEDQHPFMFALFSVLFIFSGPGKWSLDASIFNKSEE